MAASTTDKMMKTGASTVTTLSAPGKALAATSLTVGSTTNYPTTTGTVIAIRVVDSAGELVAGTYTEWLATVTSGTTLAIDAAPVYGTDQVYAAGSTTQVFIPLSSYAHNRMVDGVLVHANQDGTLKTDVAITTNAATLTSPKVITGINDTNNNELLKVTATASAVNELTLTNAATGNAVQLASTGGDTNVDFTLGTKGTGKLKLDSLYIPYKFSVTGTSTAVSASAVIVKFTTEAYDTGSNYDPSTGLFVAPIAGFYQFSTTVVVSTSNGGNNTGGFYAYLNGSNNRTLMNWAVGAISSNVGGTATFTMSLAANDTVSIYANNSIVTSYQQGTFEGRLISKY